MKLNRPDALPDCAALALELARQPEFFAPYRSEMPEKEPLLILSPRYTGARSDDEATNLRVGAMRLLGMSDRAIERECGIDRRTIPWRIAWLEKFSRIPAVKDRLAMRTGELAERSAMVLGTLLDRAQDEVTLELAQMIKAVATAHGITAEKMLLLTGQATEIVEHRIGAGRAEIEAWALENAVEVEVIPTPKDMNTTASGRISAQTGAKGDSGYLLATPETPTDPPNPDQTKGGGGGATGAPEPDTPMG